MKKGRKALFSCTLASASILLRLSVRRHQSAIHRQIDASDKARPETVDTLTMQLRASSSAGMAARPGHPPWQRVRGTGSRRNGALSTRRGVSYKRHACWCLPMRPAHTGNRSWGAA
ncbi:hypothetical protein Tamer19_07960 [Cupriavidus sp. TA19]|nr:hypothetical protein Tamer19_07960 [Cupriavidus sp. TA19]